MQSPTSPVELPPPNWTPNKPRGLRVDGRRLIVPGSLVILTLLFFGLRVPFWLIVPLALVVPGFLFWAGWYLRKELPPFERAFSLQLQRGDVRALQRLWGEHRVLRWLMPPWMRDVKLGMILMLQGRHRHAERMLEEAWDAAPPAARTQLLGPMVRVKHALGEYEDLRVLSSQWRQRSLFPGTANLYLAAAMLEQPGCERDVVEELLADASDGLAEPERALLNDLRDGLQARFPNSTAVGT